MGPSGETHSSDGTKLLIPRYMNYWARSLFFYRIAKIPPFTVTSKLDNSTERAIEKRILWKMDCHILPPIIILYSMSFLDKTNIGNARIAGLERDLHLHGTQFNMALAVFFITFILCEIPSNLVLKKVKANRWLGLLVATWGLVTILTGLTRNFAGIITARLLLGLCEGGFVPGVILYLSYMYKPQELQTRVGIYHTAVPLSGAFGGLLTSAIIQMDGIGKIAGWRWIFILEGTATFILGIMAIFVLPSDVASAKFLTEEERKYALERLRQESRDAELLSIDDDHSLAKDASAESSREETVVPRRKCSTPELEEFEWREIRRALLDIRNWLNGCSIFAFFISIQSFALFFPTIVAGLGYSGSKAQIHTVPPYALAVVLIPIVAFLSDRTKLRGPLVLMVLPLTMIGYVTAIAAKTSTARYIGACFLLAGTAPSGPCIFTAVANNNSGHYKKATAIALKTCLTGISGVIATFIYTPDQAPKYIRGHTIALSCVVFAWFMSAAHVLHCLWENKARREGRRDSNISKYKSLRDAGLTKAPIGDRHPTFRFTP